MIAMIVVPGHDSLQKSPSACEMDLVWNKQKNYSFTLLAKNAKPAWAPYNHFKIYLTVKKITVILIFKKLTLYRKLPISLHQATAHWRNISCLLKFSKSNANAASMELAQQLLVNNIINVAKFDSFHTWNTKSDRKWQNTTIQCHSMIINDLLNR